MTDTIKSRFAIDLDALEQKMQTAKQPQAQRGADPLADLARIVGQDDPFRSMLSDVRPQRHDAFDPGHAPDVDHRGFDEATPVLRYSLHDEPAPEAEPAHHQQPFDDEVAAYAQDPHRAYQPHENAAEPVAVADPYAYPPHYASDDDYGFEPEQHEEARRPRNSRKGVLAIAAVLSMVIVGVGVAFALRGSGARGPNGAPPLIKADNTPVKIQPANPGGTDIPNQNKQIYERVGEPAQGETKVVGHTEQPVDLAEAVKLADNQPADGANAAPAEQPGAAFGLGEPRRVKTVSVKPDGTIVRDAQPAVDMKPQDLAAAIPPKPVATTPVAPPSATPAAVAPVAQQVASASATDTPSAPKLADTPAPKPAAKPVGTPMSIAPMSILPQGAREAAKPAEAPRRVASTPAVPAPQAKAAPASGGYAVQLAAPGSESEANSMFAFFQRKYPDDLGNQTALIRKAEVNGRSIYRLRVGPMSHDDAISLCTRLKTAGGSCFVAKN